MTMNNTLTIVLGLGATGLSVARFLRRQQRHFVLMDSRDRPPNASIIAAEFADVRCITGRLDGDLLQTADEIVVSPGLNLHIPAIRQALASGVSIIGDIELFVRHNDQHAAIPIVAITGSNGKSTVVTLVGQMARNAGIAAAVGGNIGTPALDLLMADEHIALYILELSSFQLETTYSLRAAVATVLNISADHIDRHGSLEAYALIKQRIYHNAKCAVINRQDSLTRPPPSAAAHLLSFGLDQTNTEGFGLSMVDSKPWLTYRQTKLIPVADLFLQTGHNYANILAALAIGTALDLPMTIMLSTAKGFRGLRHRCEYILSHRQITYINDSKGTNVGAAQAAITGFGHECNARGAKIVLIAGGDGKGADFSLLLPLFKQYLRALIVMGKDADKLLTMIADTMAYERADAMTDAVALAQRHALAGDVVLLSPACSSLDMFANFEDRGDQFVQAVYEVAA